MTSGSSTFPLSASCGSATREDVDSRHLVVKRVDAGFPCGNSFGDVIFLAPATFSGKTPPTIETLAVPWIRSAFGRHVGGLVSMVTANAGWSVGP